MLLLDYYYLEESTLKINAITTLIAEWINAFTLQLLLHDFIYYIVTNIYLHPLEHRSATLTG